MNNFLSLFTLFCSSDFFSVTLEILTPFLVIFGVMSLLGVILHGKFV